MQLCVGEITKQSQTTTRFIFPGCYISRCSDGTGRQHPWCQRCANGFRQRGALPWPYLASASLLRDSEPNLGFLRLNLWLHMAYGSRRPGPSTGSANMRWVLIHFEWRKVAPQVRLKALVSWLVAIGLIATRYVTHV